VITTATESGGLGAATADLFRPAGGQLGKDEFLRLLVTQLRHQDPLNPMEAQDLAVQLAQFSSVEQLIQANERLDQQLAASEALAAGLNTTAALGVLGQTITAVTDRAVVAEDGSGTIDVEIGGTGGSLTIRLTDKDGKVLGTREVGFLEAGRHTVDLGSATSGLPAGVYRCEVVVTDGKDVQVPARLLATARVDGVRYGSQGPILIAGPLEIPLANVLEVKSIP
jgi:flagellar basal-body rod modification protein FlgD